MGCCNSYYLDSSDLRQIVYNCFDDGINEHSINLILDRIEGYWYWDKLINLFKAAGYEIIQVCKLEDLRKEIIYNWNYICKRTDNRYTRKKIFIDETVKRIRTRLSDCVIIAKINFTDFEFEFSNEGEFKFHHGVYTEVFDMENLDLDHLNYMIYKMIRKY